MLRRAPTTFLALIAASAICLSCGDSPTQGVVGQAVAPGACVVDVNALQGMVNTVFGSGTASAGTVHAKIDEIHGDLSAADLGAAQIKARALVELLHSAAVTVTGTTTQLDALVNTVLCWVGLSETSFLVKPADEPQVLKSSDGNAGIQLPANAVSIPTVITITVVDGDLLTSDDTKLDRYPRSISITSSTPVGTSVVGVCLTNIPASVLPRLHMGHRTKEGFKIEPPAPVDFLNCPTATGSLASQHGVRGLLHSLAALVLPKPLYATPQEAFLSGGVGGTAGEYSPFEPVDTELSFSGGVGGTAGEYTRAPQPGATASAVAGGTCTSADATVATGLEPECRPQVKITTANGTVLQNVPVTWTVAAGGGSTAAENSATRACDVFGTSASNATNANGKAGACWTLGANTGANTLVATVAAGGDAPAGVSFSPSTQTFNATALPVTSGAAANGESVTYNGQAHPGSGSCANALAPALSYSGDGSVPRNVGHYVLTVTCGGGVANATVTTATADITILTGAASVTLTCPASLTYTGEPLTPCTAVASAPGAAVTAVPVYASNVNGGTAHVTASVAGTANYSGANASRDFQILRAISTTTVTCPASIAYSGAVQTPCSAKVTGVNLVPAVDLDYATPPRDAGVYTASATFDGDANHTGSTASATFSITPLAATATAGSGAMTLGGAMPALPCVVTVLPADADAISCTTLVPPDPVIGNNVTTPKVTPGDAGNYAISLVNGALTVSYIQSTCFDWPLSSTLPLKSQGLIPGVPFAAVCELRNAQGGVITNASAELEVFDLGPEGASAPVRVIDRPNAFGLFLGAYWGWIDTSDLARGHFFRVAAIWNDGSESSGYFYMR